MITLSHTQWDKINSMALAIHEEQDICKLRTDFLTAIDELIPHDKSFFDLGHKRHTKVVFFDPVSANIDDEYLASYFQEYEPVDTMFWFFSQTDADIYRESDYITKAMHNASIYHKEWLSPQGIRYSMGSRVSYGDILYGSVNLWRSPDHGDFSDEELHILRILNQHLSLHLHSLFPNGIRRGSENEYTDTVTHLYNLTKRESEIVSCIYQGLSNRDISEKMFISENTVKKHSHNIFRKMNVSNRSQLIKLVHNYMTTSVDHLSEPTQ